MKLLRWVATDRYHYRARTLIVAGLCGLLLFICVVSVMLMRQVADQAQKPLQALNTELIVQKPSQGERSQGLKTGGLITPFTMGSFKKNRVTKALNRFNFVNAVSSALILWSLDTRGTLVLAGIKHDEPAIGLRAIESMLVKGSFFSSDNADEVILERHYAAFYSHNLGSHYHLQDRDLKIVGIVDFVDQSNLNTAAVFLPYETAAHLSGLESGIVNQIFVALASAADTEQLTERTKDLLSGFQTITRDSLYKNLKGLNGVMLSFGKGVTTILFGATLLLGGFLLKIHLSDFHKNGETLAMLGWPARLIRRWILLDIGVILLIATLFCAILTALFSYTVLPSVNVPPPALQELVL